MILRTSIVGAFAIATRSRRLVNPNGGFIGEFFSRRPKHSDLLELHAFAQVFIRFEFLLNIPIGSMGRIV